MYRKRDSVLDEWLPMQFFEPANGAFRIRRQFDKRCITAGGCGNANEAVALVGPLRQVGVRWSRIAAGLLLVQRLERGRESLGQFWQRNGNCAARA